ncbi:MAG: DUF805 domain-containing protein [Gammaproteobacteria bacterium]
MEPNNPYESPKSNPATSSSETYQPKIFSINGRIGRLRYLAYGMFFTIITLFIIGIAAFLIPSIATLLTDISGVTSALLLIVLYLPLIIISIILVRRRLNDLDRSGWWQILMYVPLVGILFALYVLFWPGTKGSNSFGLQPSENSTGIKIVALLIPIGIALLGILAAIAIPAFQDYTVRAEQALESNQNAQDRIQQMIEETENN